MSMLISVVALCLASGLILLLVRWVEAGLFTLLAIELFDLAFGGNATLVGRLHLSPLDAVSMALLTAGMIRFLRSLRRIHLGHVVVCAYVLLFAWSFVRGCGANGLLAAANEARGFVPSLAAMLYFSSAPFDERSLRRFVKLYLLFGAGLCVVMLLAVLGVPVGATLNLSPDDNRVLPSNAAAALAICAFFALARATYSSQRITGFVSTGIFLAAAIALRHRTVWMMLLAGAVALLFVDVRLLRRLVPIAVFASTAVAMLVLAGGATQMVASQGEFAQSLSNSETWRWRVNGWEGFLLDTDQTPLTVLAGKPMGSGWWRIDPESHLLQMAPPHSELVTEYLRVGGLGLLLVVLFACRPLWVMWRDGGIDGAVYPSASIWFAVVAMTLVYGITYSIEPESYALVGIASAMAAGTSTAAQIEVDVTDDEAGESSPTFAS